MSKVEQKKAAVAMSQALINRKQANELAIETALIEGDLSRLDVTQRLQYVKMVCKSVRLNPLTKPFDYIRFEGKVILYLNRGGAEQLRKIHRISIKNALREFSKERETYTVIVSARNPKEDREEDGLAVVSLAGLRGKDLANAMMKCVTKAKRRATLAICGLSQFDTPTGEEEPIKQSAIEERIEEVSAKTETEERPAFESVLTDEETKAIEEISHGEGENLPPVPPSDQGYVMRGGKNKGKLLKDMPKSKLNKWMEWYSKQMEAGKPLHPDIQDDAFQITAHLAEEGQING